MVVLLVVVVMMMMTLTGEIDVILNGFCLKLDYLASLNTEKYLTLHRLLTGYGEISFGRRISTGVWRDCNTIYYFIIANSYVKNNPPATTSAIYVCCAQLLADLIRHMGLFRALESDLTAPTPSDSPSCIKTSFSDLGTDLSQFSDN